MQHLPDTVGQGSGASYLLVLKQPTCIGRAAHLRDLVEKLFGTRDREHVEIRLGNGVQFAAGREEKHVCGLNVLSTPDESNIFVDRHDERPHTGRRAPPLLQSPAESSFGEEQISSGSLQNFALKAPSI